MNLMKMFKEMFELQLEDFVWISSESYVYVLILKASDRFIGIADRWEDPTSFSVFSVEFMTKEEVMKGCGLCLTLDEAKKEIVRGWMRSQKVS